MSKLDEIRRKIVESVNKLIAFNVSEFWNRLVVRAGFRHPVRSMQVVLDYPKPGPRRSRFTGIAAMRREARHQRNRRNARV